MSARPRVLVFLILLAVGVAAIGLVEGVLQVQLVRSLDADVQADMARRTRVTARAVSTHGGPSTAAELDALADALGDDLGARVTVIRADGEVLGDSWVDLAALGELDNHGHRPEVLASSEGEVGVSRRFSDTVRTDMLYVALPFSRPDGGGWARVALPLDDLERAVQKLRLTLVLAGVAALALAALASATASYVVVGQLRDVVVETRAMAGTDPSDEPPMSVGELRGELSRTVGELAGQRALLAAVLDGLREGVVAHADGQVTLANAVAVALLGGELVGRPVADALPVVPDSSGEPVEARVGDRALEVSGAALLGGGGVVVLRDVTELRRLERVRRDFVANVSHELRTPIAVVLGNAETLLDGALWDAEIAERLVEAIDRQGKRLAQLVSDLLDLSRIEAGEITLEPEEIAVEEAAVRLAEGMRVKLRGRRVSVDVEVPPGAMVEADRRSFEQILVNLLDNAIKYASARVAVRASVGDVVRITVDDDGPGIPPEHRERVFERFYRVDPGRSREVGGTGLGLAIVRHLAVSMGGSVRVDGSPLGGTRVALELPRAGVGAH